MSYRALSSCIFDEFWHPKLLRNAMLGTKHISTAFIWSCRLVPSNALSLCSRAAHLSRPSSFTILFFWDSFILRSMVDDILMGYAGWANWEYIVCWDTSFAPRFCGFTSIGSGWAVDFASSGLDLKACSSRLVSFVTSSLRLSVSFRCWAPTGLFLCFSFVFFAVECYKCVSMGDLYFTWSAVLWQFISVCSNMHEDEHNILDMNLFFWGVT